MERSIRTALAGAVSTAALLAATPALAQSYGRGADDAVGAGVALFTLFCFGLLGIVYLLLVVLNIWMFIDALTREEHEYPGSTGNSKVIWIVLLVAGFFFLGSLPAIFYYFMVYRKARRGAMRPPHGPMGGGYGQGGYPPQQGGYAPPQGGYAPPPPPPPPPPGGEGTVTPAPPAPTPEEGESPPPAPLP